jgi:hypothetical protein
MSDSSSYPRSQPFRPPTAEVQAPRPDAQFRAFALKLAIGTVAMVMVIVVLGVGMAIWLLRPSATPAAAQPVAAGPGRTPDGPPAGAPANQRPAEAIGMPTARGESDPSTPHLEAIGSLTVAHLYGSYLNIGMLYDVVENDIYSVAEAKKLLSTVNRLIDSVDEQLAQLEKTRLETDDRKRVLRMRELTALLRTQAKELRAYWETPDTDSTAAEEHEAKYKKAREESWVGIEELSGVE